MAHGFDQFSAGVNQLITGKASYTLTEQVLQKSGLSSETSTFVNNSISTFGSSGAMGGMRSGQSIFSTTFPSQTMLINPRQIFVHKAPNGAENINSNLSLSTKLRQLETAQKTAAKIRTLPDGRIRYYKTERLATYLGPTRGSAYVVEYNPKTGQVRGWNECYDQLGIINRIHPKDLNGQSLNSSHYPLINQEISP